ncbi:HlyD family secretion protein [Niabella sp.]|uniref:HlyD family secretion protein n=1 Tax=Niabella sp. TaxID=1962976 RepID=UPI00261848A8|nr:HlyD family secretion protein [Niabella sp.]
MENQTSSKQKKTGFKNYWALLIPLLILLIALLFLLRKDKKPGRETITGMVDAATVDVSAGMPGRLEALNVKTGDTVTEGQLLATLKSESLDIVKSQAGDAVNIAQQNLDLLKRGVAPEVLKSAVNIQDIAEQQLQLVTKTYDRMIRLYDQGVISGQEKDLISFKYEAAKKELETAKLNVELLRKGSNPQMLGSAQSLLSQAKGAEELAANVKEKASIHAPAAGIITTLVSKQGEMVNAGYPIMTIQKEASFFITFNVRQDLMTRLPKGAVADLKIPGCVPENIKGTVTELAPALGYANWVPADQSGQMELRTFSIKVVPQHMESIQGLRSGMTAQLLLP